jgi:hypothetical protein
MKSSVGIYVDNDSLDRCDIVLTALLAGCVHHLLSFRADPNHAAVFLDSSLSIMLLELRGVVASSYVVRSCWSMTKNSLTYVQTC